MKATGFFRRFLCTVTAALLLALPALAEPVDLSALSDDEVVALLQSVNDEIVSRGIAKTAKLPLGKYLVGRDLPAGRYIYTCMAKGDDWGNVTVYSEGGKGDLLTWEVVSAAKEGEEPETIFLTLNDGEQLESDVPFSLTVMTGSVFR